MRITLLAFAILPLLAIGQSDCRYKTNEVDEFTGKVIKETKVEEIGYWVRRGYRLYGSVLQIDDNIYGRILLPSRELVKSTMCLSSSSYVMVKFTDDRVIRAEYVGKVDCDRPTMAWGMDPDMLEALSAQTIKGIRIGTSDGYMDLEVNDPELFIRHMRCVEILSE